MRGQIKIAVEVEAHRGKTSATLVPQAVALGTDVGHNRAEPGFPVPPVPLLLCLEPFPLSPAPGALFPFQIQPTFPLKGKIGFPDASKADKNKRAEMYIKLKQSFLKGSDEKKKDSVIASAVNFHSDWVTLTIKALSVCKCVLILI